MDMAILDARDDLLEQLSRFGFVELATGNDVVEQLTVGNVLENDEDVGGGVCVAERERKKQRTIQPQQGQTKTNK
jgi:hypothetical protein